MTCLAESLEGWCFLKGNRGVSLRDRVGGDGWRLGGGEEGETAGKMYCMSEESEKNVNGLLVIIRTLGLYEFIFLLELVLLLKNTK